MIHALGCASLERNAQCTCGADRVSARGWWPIGLALAGLAAVVVMVWLW